MHWTEDGKIQVTKNFATGTAAVIVGLALVMMFFAGMLISRDGDSDPRVQADPTENDQSENEDTSMGTASKTKYSTCAGVGCSTEEDASPTGQPPNTQNTATPPVNHDEILTMVPSNIGGLIFILDMKAIRESRDQLPGDYLTFAQDIEQRIEGQLDTDEITANEVDTFVFAAPGLILVRGDFKYEDIRFQWQGEDYRKRTYRGYEIWDGANTYAILEDRRTVIGSEHEAYVKDFIRVHDGSRTSLADEEDHELTRVIKKLGPAMATMAVSQDSDCSHRIKRCRAYGLTYISTDNHQGKAEINLALLLENEARARNVLEDYKKADETMQRFAVRMAPGIHPGLPSIDSVQIGEIRREGSFLLAQATVDIK